MGERDRVIDELHRPARRNYPRIPVVTKGIDDLWQADLVEMNSGTLKGLSRINRGMKFMLTVIDTFSKYAWAVPLKFKNGKDVTAAFRNIIKISERRPKFLQTDRGREFYNSEFSRFVKHEGIKHYSTFSELKASIVERFNRTLKNMMWKQFTRQGNYKWITILPDIMATYNNTRHSTIKMKPAEVDKRHEAMLFSQIYCPKYKPSHLNKYRVGDYVRVSKLKRVFDKGFTRNWSTETFKIHKVFSTAPPTYLLQDAKGEVVQGRFYEQKLQRSKYPDIYLIEKIIRRDGDRAYVKWLGLPERSWIKLGDVVR